VRGTELHARGRALPRGAASLTRAIKALEDELGGALFHRERANTHLSELGRTLKPYLEQVYNRAEQAKREAQEFVRLQKTTLRLGLMCTIAPGFLLDLVAAIRRRHPGIELQIVDAAAPELQERLAGGTLDIAIYALPELAVDDRLHHLALYREQFRSWSSRSTASHGQRDPSEGPDGEHYICGASTARWARADAE